MISKERFLEMLKSIAEAASSSAVAEEVGSQADVDYWEKETEERIAEALAAFESKA